MKKIAFFLFALLFVGPTLVRAATQYQVYWTPSTQYTDNTPITKQVAYSVFVDNVLVASGVLTTAQDLPAMGSGVAHRVEVAAVVDNVSSGRAGVDWTAPFLTPAMPGAVGIRVKP